MVTHSDGDGSNYEPVLVLGLFKESLNDIHKIRHMIGDKHSHINGKAPITPTGFISSEVLLTPFSKCR